VYALRRGESKRKFVVMLESGPGGDSKIADLAPM